MKKLILISFVVSAFIACNEQKAEKPIIVDAYPLTQKGDTVDTYFGTDVPDPYRWMEDDMSDETADWVSEQNKVTFSYLNNIPYRENLKKRLTELFDYERVYAPTSHGEYDYFYRK